MEQYITDGRTGLRYELMGDFQVIQRPFRNRLRLPYIFPEAVRSSHLQNAAR